MSNGFENFGGLLWFPKEFYRLHYVRKSTPPLTRRISTPTKKQSEDAPNESVEMSSKSWAPISALKKSWLSG